MRDGLIDLPHTTDADWHHRLRVEAATIEHLRWTLWNGGECVDAADCAITDFRLELTAHARAARHAGQDVARIDDILDQLADFRRYLYANARSPTITSPASTACGCQRRTSNPPSTSW